MNAPLSVLQCTSTVLLLRATQLIIINTLLFSQVRLLTTAVLLYPNLNINLSFENRPGIFQKVPFPIEVHGPYNYLLDPYQSVPGQAS